MNQSQIERKLKARQRATLQPGAKVITASALTSSHWTTGELARRKPGAEGVVELILVDPGECNRCERCHEHGAYLVTHGPGLPAHYHGDELTLLRKRAGLEQALDVEERLSKLEAQHSRSLDAMARELNGLETSLEHCQDRLQVLEQDSERVCRQGVPRGWSDRLNAEAAIEAAQSLMDLDSSAVVAMLRNRSRQRWESGDLGPSPERLIAAADVLEAVPDLVAAAQAATVRPSELQALRAVAEAAHQLSCLQPEVTEPVGRLNDALQALDELDASEEQSSPYAGVHDDSGLIPDACREIERLQEELEQTTQAVRHLTCAPETVSLHDALEAARWQTEEYGCAESALRAELGGTAGLADLAREAVIQIRGGTAGILLYRRLSDPEAYNEPDPDKLAGAALIARTSQQKQAEVLSDLREIFGADEAGFGLRELATRAVRHAAPVLRLLETYNAVEIDGFRSSLVRVTAPLVRYKIARGIVEMLAEVVALAEGERATDRHAAGCADVRCKGCATSTQSKR